jgi:hypothetical protein
MDGPAVGVIAFIALFGSALGGVVAHARLPPAVLTVQTRVTIGRSVTMLAGLATLLLALMTVYMVRQFDTARQGVGYLSWQIVELDHVLRQAEPEAAPARELLFRYGARTLKDVWPGAEPRLPADGSDRQQLLTRLEDAVTALHPAAPEQQAALNRARQIVQTLVDTAWSLDPNQSSILSPWLTVMLVFCLVLAFGGWGLIAPRTKLSMASLSLCAVAAAGGIFVMVDYGSAFAGLIMISSEPLQNALFVIAAGG